MAFHLTVAGSLEPLADRLAAVLADPLDDPFTPELVAVPGGGVQAWLTAQLARRLGSSGAGVPDGVVANVEFVFPAGIVERAVGEGAGVGRWSTGPLTWAVHAVLQELGPELGQPTDAVRARAIADLFDRYTLYRPQMVRNWSDGRDLDGTGAPLESHHLWQPALWRAVQDHLGGDTDEQLLRRAAERLARGAVPPEVPARVVVFGLASLPSPHLSVLTALAAHREVHVLAPTPSPEGWRRVDEQLARLGPLGLPVERSDETVAVGAANPLLGGWGAASREAHAVLIDAARGVGARPEPPADEVELASGATVLQRVQHGVRTDEAQPAQAERRPLLDPVTDHSLRWHRAHGPARQVEVLRDALLHLFEERDERGGARFEPRDVAVLCPDPSRFAPLVEAVFAGDPDHGVPALPVRVADRSLRQDNAVLDTAAALLELLEGRFRASSVVAFASRPPVRLRFGLDADALTRISEWADATNVRWGLGPDDQAAFGLPDLDVHTWRAGLDQLLVGATMASSDIRLGPGEVALHCDVEGADVEVAGALAELVERLDTAVRRLRAGRTVDGWCTALATALSELCAVDDGEAWQWRAVERVIEQLREEASVDGVPRTTEVDPADLAALARARLGADGGRPRFGTGTVTVSSLTAQRGVPHRVVCLLGLDDDVAAGALPAAEDLVAAKPCIGDRDPRSEQRAQLLDAVLAAQERLLLFSTGHDVRTNVELPAPVPVAELLDVVDTTVRLADGGRPRDAITVHHPRQAWSEAALVPGALDVPGRPWSFDKGALAAARARRERGAGAAPFLSEPLPPVPPPSDAPAELPLDELVTACTNAPELLLRHRLGVSLPSIAAERDDVIPLELGPLEKWQVTDRLLRVRLGCDPAAAEEQLDAWVLAERRRGAVPPLAFGDEQVTEASRRVEALHDRLRDELDGIPYEPVTELFDAVVELPGGPRRLVGAVPGVCHHLVVTVSASRVRAKQRLQAWVQAAALTLARPDVPWEVVVVGRDPSGRDKADVIAPRVRMVDLDAAREALAFLDDLRSRALRDAVPVVAQTSWELWCKGPQEARKAWDDRLGGDGSNRWVALTLGDDFDAVARLPLRPDEPGPAGPACRLGWWAERLGSTYERTTGQVLRAGAVGEVAS